MYFKAQIRYYQEDNKGTQKHITETYLVDAVSHTDAEVKLFETLPSNLGIKIARLTPLKVQEIFKIDNGAETWYKVKVNFMSFDEKSQKEKRTPFNMLVNATNPVNAYNYVAERLGTVMDYQITNVDLTNILEVIN